VLAVCLALAAGVAPLGAAELTNPFENDESAIRIGGALFAGRCAECHGPDARGKLGPDLTQRWARGETDESAFRVIRGGVAGSSMPPSSAPDNEIWAIVAYLRSIGVVPPLVSSGDVDRGRALFGNECARCHKVGASGGSLGPDLTTIGATRSRAALTSSVRDPSASVALGFRAVTLVTRGEEIDGVVKSEDAYSLQVQTLAGELRAFVKRDLASLERSADSPMPIFDAARLDDTALEDLVAYLGTLRGSMSP
jgi:putative heme-binding domain-containing protein